jgi:hypothetical protein
VAGLVAPVGVGRWLAGLAAAVTLAAAGTLAVMSGTASPGDPPKPPDKPADGPKATAERRLPATTPLFKRTTVGCPSEFTTEGEKAAMEWLSGVYGMVTKARRSTGHPLIPPGRPQIVGTLVVYANDEGVASIAINDDKGLELSRGEYAWAGVQFDSLVWRGRPVESQMSLAKLFGSHPVDRAAELMYSRTLSTSFVVQNQFMFAVDELGIVPAGENFRKNGTPELFGSLNDAMKQNGICAWDVATGKIEAKFKDEQHFVHPIAKTLYLGPPILADEQFCAIHQPDRTLHLTSVRWKRPLGYLNQRTASAAKALVNWDTELVTSPKLVFEDPHRRIHAIHLTRAGDLILCPTHLGRVVAVEAKTGKVRWTHEYAPLDAKRFPTFAPEWVVVPPAVVGDRYVYAPADFPELLCLNVADGKKVWSVKKGDGLYPAVVGEGEQVLVVGEKAIRSLSLKDGSEQWKADLPGLPCGRGAVLGDAYLVPVSEPKTWKGLIAVVDLKAGKVAEVLRPEKDEPIGNLVVHGDFLISQTLTEIAVFPIRKKE